ncbi:MULTISPECIES: N-acetylglucosamine-6-phosphate deacetylase [Actinoalloteichus]|uniref:N-acetylglucosamine-6-phosphate deacetylase n=1 Tax=Actinoalloteichus fjordicus TaxID=1612552 RepID=A0AAC9LHK4_9PSEU|nr:MULTISPECIES: amidohydrolase family protein [Actinoalloteichus]APU16454.1 N-acetylglucosamine-6-phosphate deacetylase [Actinoalloteichus fjordicus]APU22513.1 N-acetylglucosamine-6-phosphate deacetylase [Actinoalloteichus sp. GBA129-24]
MIESTRLVLIGGAVVLPDGVRRGLGVHVEGGRIVDLTDREPPVGARVIELDGRLVTPGLIDLHVHGGAGYSFDRPSRSVEGRAAEGAAAWSGGATAGAGGPDAHAISMGSGFPDAHSMGDGESDAHALGGGGPDTHALGGGGPDAHALGGGGPDAHSMGVGFPDAHSMGVGFPDAVTLVLRHLARAGVTSAQASLVSSDVPDLVSWLDDPIWTAARPADAAELLGVHLEGPFLAATQCGAHDPAVLRAPSRDDVAALLSHRELIRMITLAPELPGAIEAVRRFAEAGIVVAAGHSEATAADLAAATDAGLTHVTHLWSGQSTTTRRGPWRVPGLLEASLAATGLTAEVIADGHHLPPELLEIARRCLGDRLIVVSDGTPGTGLPTGSRYDLGTVRCEVGDGVGMVVGADSFGGSTATLPRLLAHLHDELGWPLTEVVTAATSRPAAVAGVADRKGVVEVGMDADLAVFDPGFRPWGTVLRGRWTPNAPTAPDDRRSS